MEELERPLWPSCHEIMSILAGMNKRGVFEVEIFCEWCDYGTASLLITDVKRSDIRRYVKGIEGEETRTLTFKS